MSIAERDLDRLLGGMAPELREGEFVFVSVDPARPPAVDVLASVREAEGLSLVVARDVADSQGLAYDFVAGWITLTVHSALDAVGVTATVASALANAGISCNVIAGAHHDHLLVPAERAGDALSVLGGLVDRARSRQ